MANYLANHIVIFVTLLCLASVCYNIGNMNGYAEAMRDAEEALDEAVKKTIEKIKRQEET